MNAGGPKSKVVSISVKLAELSWHQGNFHAAEHKKEQAIL
jgi:hypothetical protein